MSALNFYMYITATYFMPYFVLLSLTTVTGVFFFWFCVCVLPLCLVNKVEYITVYNLTPSSQAWRLTCGSDLCVVSLPIPRENTPSIGDHNHEIATFYHRVEFIMSRGTRIIHSVDRDGTDTNRRHTFDESVLQSHDYHELMVSRRIIQPSIVRAWSARRHAAPVCQFCSS